MYCCGLVVICIQLYGDYYLITLSLQAHILIYTVLLAD